MATDLMSDRLKKQAAWWMTPLGEWFEYDRDAGEHMASVFSEEFSRMRGSVSFEATLCLLEAEFQRTDCNN